MRPRRRTTTRRRFTCDPVAAQRHLLERFGRHARDEAALDELIDYLQARAEWIPNYRRRRRDQQYIGSGQVEKTNDLLVARRQKRGGTQWSQATGEGLAALRTLLLIGGWERSWVNGEALPFAEAA
jgi:hypothetical protein